MKKDMHGNPAGTVYNEAGMASHPDPKVTGLKNAPQPTEADAKPILYNEDGSVFTIPADADKVKAQFSHDITALSVAISKGKSMMIAAESMRDEADEADKPLYQKGIDKQKIAIESNEAAKAKLEAELAEYKLGLITPAERAIVRELEGLYIKRTELNNAITVLENKRKLYTGTDSNKKPAAEEGSTERTPEQAAYHAKMVELHGSQGKAIVALAKEGKTNSEIYKLLGIPPASVPGPKGAFLKSEEGKGWKVGDDNVMRKIA